MAVENRNIYALLIGVGDYQKLNILNLPTYSMDLMLIQSALTSGLKMPREHIRLLTGEGNKGCVTRKDMARALAGFKDLLKEDSSFILYFSGHGRDRNLTFSDGDLSLQSLVDFMDTLAARDKILILDCCYSGNFTTAGARRMHFEDAIADFAGHGIAVLASSSADQVSRLGPGANHSLFTGALSTAMVHNKKIRKGRLSLTEINEEAQRLVRAWNQNNPGKEQHPVFRSSMGGTIYFQVTDYQPYQQRELSYETENYRLVKVEPLSSPSIKRLCAFVIPKGPGDLSALSAYTREIADRIKHEEIYSGPSSEARFAGTPARAVWCYFCHDESDMVNHLYYAYTIWASDEDMRRLYFKPDKNAAVTEDIYLWENQSYDSLKKIYQSRQSREDFIKEHKMLLADIVNLAEEFIVDLQELANGTVTIETLRARYGDWIAAVREKYILLTETEIAPDDLHDWSEEILTLAGWILDMALMLDQKGQDGVIGERELWLIHNAVRQYYESLEKLGKLDARRESFTVV